MSHGDRQCSVCHKVMGSEVTCHMVMDSEVTYNVVTNSSHIQHGYVMSNNRQCDLECGCMQCGSYRPTRGIGGDCVLLAAAPTSQLGPHLIMSHNVKEENEHTLHMKTEGKGECM